MHGEFGRFADFVRGAKAAFNGEFNFAQKCSCILECSGGLGMFVRDWKLPSLGDSGREAGIPELSLHGVIEVFGGLLVNPRILSVEIKKRK